MTRFTIRIFFLFYFIAFPVLFTKSLASNFVSETSQINSLPLTMIWAWERNEDLSFIDPKNVGVACFAGTIYLKEKELDFKPRCQLFKIPAKTVVIPVLRIENLDSHKAPDINSAVKICAIVKQALKSATLPIVQLDYDARLSDREFYCILLKELRKELPGTAISITALASWCISDRWLNSEIVDEAVAMLFSMGVSEQKTFDKFANKDLSFTNSGSRDEIIQSIGLSVSEPKNFELYKHKNLDLCFKRRYFFCSKPWTKKSYSQIFE